MILATDMAKHKEILDELENYATKFDFKNKEHLESVNHLNRITFILLTNKKFSNEKFFS